MKESKRTRHLESASLKTSIFALISAVLSAISGFYLYKIIMDALPDNTLEVYYSFLKPIKLGSLEINTAQQTMALGIILFLIPFWLLISFLVKRHSLSNGDTVGTGLYWFLLLTGLIGILYFLGMLTKLLTFNFSNLGAINTDLFSIIGTILSALVVILSIWTLINIAMAERSPIDYEEDYDDEIEEEVEVKRTTRRPRRTNHVDDEIIDEVVEDTVVKNTSKKVISPADYGYDEVEVKKPVTRRVTKIVKSTANKPAPAVNVPENLNNVEEPKIIPTDSSIKEPKISDTIIMKPITPEKVVVEPSEDEPRLVKSPVSNTEVKENVNEIVSEEVDEVVTESDDIINEDVKYEAEEVSPSDYDAIVSDPHDVDNQPKNVFMEEGTSTPIFTSDFMDHDEAEELQDVDVNTDPEPVEVVEEPVNETVPVENATLESTGTIKEEEIKVTRRYIEMPGEDKVIVVTREYDSAGRLLDEKTEVKDKKDLNL